MTTGSILEKIESSRKDLLDLSLRNPLLNYRTLRARGVETIEADPISVFKMLVGNGKKVSFIPEDDERKIGNSGRRANLLLRASGTSGELQRRLLNTYRTSNTIIQEQGVNTLFMALGMVVWHESDDSEVERRAPIIFVPVRLDRANINSGFSVSYTGEDLGSNISFAEKARADFRLDVPLLDEDEDAASADLKSYFREIERSVRGMKGWSVDKTSVVLGFFTFSKFLMYRDLDAENWPSGSGPLGSEIIRALFRDGFSEPEPEISEDDYLDDHLKPQDTHHVVDADSSQSLAIHDANSGRNLVIQGPPGTGKSQTITNVIAEAIGQRKKVLFVSEKMAALEVVKRRLDELHIGDACLELHSHKTTKRIVLDDLRRTLELGRPSTEGIEDDFVTLMRILDRLNRYAKAVNDPVGNASISPFDIFGELKLIQGRIQNDYRLPRPQVSGMDSWSRSDFDEKLQVVSDLQNSLRLIGVLKEHPFWGSELRVVLPHEIAALQQSIHHTERSLNVLVDSISSLANAMDLYAPESIGSIPRLLLTSEIVCHMPKGLHVPIFGAREWRERRHEIENLRDSGTRWKGLHSRYDSVLTSDAWDADVIADRNELAATGPNFLKFLSRAPRAVHTLRLDAAEWRDRRGEVELLRDSGTRWQDLHSRYDSVLTPDAWNADVVADRNELADTGSSFLKFFSGRYRRAKKRFSLLCRDEIPARLERQLELADAIIEENQLRQTINQLSQVANSIFHSWQLESVDWDEVSNLINWSLSMPDNLYLRYSRAQKRLSTLCRSELPDELERQLELADAIIEESRLWQTIVNRYQLARNIFHSWQPESADWDEVAHVINWTLELLDDIGDGTIDPEIVRFLDTHPNTEHIQELWQNSVRALEVYRGCVSALSDSLEMDFVQRFNHADGLAGLPFEEQNRILREWTERVSEIQDMAAVNNALHTANNQGLRGVTKLVEEWPDAPEYLAVCFELAWYERILSRAFSERPALHSFNRLSHQSDIQRFADMDNLVLDHTERECPTPTGRNCPGVAAQARCGYSGGSLRKRDVISQ